MRIIYDNLIDDLVATNMTALTTNASYPVANMQDERLSTRWRSTAATSQSLIFNAGGEPNFIGDEYTNLVTDPTDLTTANWTESNVTATTSIETINDNAFTKITNAGANAGWVEQTFATSFTNLVLTGRVTIRKGSSSGNTTLFVVRNDTAGASIFLITLDWDNYASSPGVVSNGTLLDYTWLDSETVEINFQCTALANLTDDVIVKCYGSNNATDAEYTLWTEVQLIDSDAITMYPFVSGTHSADNIQQAFVMPDKLIIDLIINPKFLYDTSSSKVFWSWYVGATERLSLFYGSSSDKLILAYADGTQRTILSDTFDNGSSLSINQRLRVVCSVDVSSGGISDSRFIIIPLEAGVISDKSEWDGVPDIKSTTFPTLSIGNQEGGSLSDVNFEYLRIYGGLLTETITDSDDVTDALATRTAMLDLEYQGKFDFDTVALMGHNLSEGATITFQANDYDAWEYTATGGSIIQSTMTWDSDTILYFLTRTQKQYVKFSLSDPNNTGAYIEIGRPWIGQYLDISPSSLLDFKVTKKRSDTVIHGKDRHKWSVIGAGWRRFELSFPPTEEAIGNHSSMIFCNFDTVRSFQLVEPCYVSIDGDFELLHTRRMVWTWSLMLEEER